MFTVFLLAGTPEAGGWTMRELKRILTGLAGLNIVYVIPICDRSARLLMRFLIRGADIVEVSPPFDHGASIFFEGEFWR